MDSLVAVVRSGTNLGASLVTVLVFTEAKGLDSRPQALVKGVRWLHTRTLQIARYPWTVGFNWWRALSAW
jgi:hypothetical protein